MISVLRPKHPDTLHSMASLASTYWQQGWSEKAKALEVQVLDLRKDVLGNLHPDTLQTAKVLAFLWLHMTSFPPSAGLVAADTEGATGAHCRDEPEDIG